MLPYLKREASNALTIIQLPLFYNDCIRASELSRINWAVSLSSDMAYNSEVLTIYKPTNVILGAYYFHTHMSKVVDIATALNNHYNTIVDISYLTPQERQYIHKSPIENWRYIGISLDDPFTPRALDLYRHRYVPIQRIIYGRQNDI